MRYALTLLCLLAPPAVAQGTMVVIPVYSQLLHVAVPDGFKAGFENTGNKSYIVELVQSGETVENWRQLITVTGAKGAASGATALAWTKAWGKLYAAACPRTFKGIVFPQPTIKGAADVFAGYVGCGTFMGHSESVAFLVLKGAEDIYMVQWAEHGPAQDKPLDPNMNIWSSRVRILSLTRICDRVPGEKAPYPSCTQ